MQKKYCPYPGLRPFTQEESIFFKGRDLHIRQVINQLEERKIVMLTGASGDGKSSLVYAGVIPNAAAGFFRAEYNNWLFVDFRPEREPLKNLAINLAEKLKIDKNKVEDELQYGFSSVVNLYKSTHYYINKESENWKKSDEYEKKQTKNKAANLFILADQFEEFFTNKENYNNGKPSAEAYTTINLLLETARISIVEKLPIYVVFTMRSDFISQCVAFKGLPEFIGFSQFFIPRLKRNELQQVIEEPAMLSGGKISSRLVEVLINELHDGFDQLPVLQHTLNSLWKIAENGDETIDLIHLAKISGLNPKYLNDEDKKEFDLWFQNIEPYKKDFFTNFSLSNVLNSHANELYLTAFDYFQKNIDWAEKNISEEDAKFIIKITFQSLTKIDEGRAVRNRMSLAEITRIINKPHITCDIVCGVMNIFRLPSNTFVRPFIDEKDVATQYLSIESVWDITHEALIRNWEMLIKWEEEEYQTLANFKDFSNQLNRWTESNKSNLFLLPAGNLAHFEDWYNTKNVNPYWISKYDNSEISRVERDEKSYEIHKQTELYLFESRRHIENIENSNKRARKGLLAGSLIAIIVLAVLTFWALNEKSKAEKQKIIAENEKIIAQEAKKEAEDNANAAYIASLQSDSARAIAEEMRLIAEEKTLLAQQESQRALREKNKAEQQRKIAENLKNEAEEQRIIAENQKTKAEQQREIAEKATLEAQKLSYLALAQALTFKAEQTYTDTQINLFLAYLAYKINEENGGDYYDASIYNSLQSALLKNGNNHLISSLPHFVTSIYYSGKSTFNAVSRDGSFFIFDLENNKIKEEKNFFNDIPVNRSFIFENEILFSLEDKSLILIYLEDEKQKKIKGHDDFVRAAIIVENKDLLITGGRDKTVKFWDLSSKKAVEMKSIEFNEKITNLILTSDNQSVYGSTANGEIFKIDINEYDYQLINHSLETITCLEISTDEKHLIAGTIQGNVYFVDLEMNKSEKINIGKSKIDAIAINKNNELFAVAASDKSVNIFQFKNIEAKPFTLSNLSKKVIQMFFNQNNELYGITENQNIYKWLTNNNVLADEVLSILQRNLTQEEWDKFIGETVEYRKLILDE